jgi:DNA invertase Pin-like site-specific DNA recombinase
VSTYNQAAHGNSLEEQKRQLKAAGAEEVYADVFTGKQLDRPELQKLIDRLNRGDTLIVTKLDRLGRSVSQASALITRLIDAGITINVLNVGVLSDDSVSTLFRNILLSFAQFERDMIVERTTEGKEICRETKPDWREGRKQIETPDFEKFLKKQKDGELTVAECCEKLNISRRTWYNRVSEVG